ncbi:MAG: hypothetical protein QHJ82_09535 [Verrucomicrobiota bacterium]|nr:hypothetical protein [Verrucomicrobiota bacterium]
MKTTTVFSTAMLLVLFANQQTAYAIEDLRLQIQGTDAVLSWPSIEGETFIVRYRPRLDEAHPWTLLTNDYSAATGTNRTTFTHVGMVEYPVAGGGGSGGGGNPPLLEGASTGQDDSDTDKTEWPPLPPAPWDARWFRDPKDQGEEATTESGGEVPLGAIGFYQVVRHGVHFIGLTNGMQLTGAVGLPIEVGHPEGELLHVTIMIDDYGTEAAAMLKPPFPTPFLYFTLDTRLLSNGVHTIQAEATWMVHPANPDPAALVDIASPVMEIEVFNEISFPNWSFHFGELYDSLLINAVSAHPEVDWEVAIFDSQNQYVGSFFGHTTDGQIRAVWNLIDPFGVRRDDPWFDADIYTMWEGGEAVASAPGSQAEVRMVYRSRSSGGAGLESGGTAATTPPKFKSFDQWPTQGNWVVANQQAFDQFIDHDLLDQMTDNFVGAAESRGYTVFPLDRPPGEALRLHVGPPHDPTNDWNTLRVALIEPSARNFYYFGHGGKNQIGSGTDAWTHISATQLYSALATANPNAANRHAYRYVFCDGCETAAGDLPLAFGIPKKKVMRLNDFLDDGRRPCAFMGWSKTKWIGLVGKYVWHDHVNFITHLQYEWIEQGKTLRQAAKDAAEYPDASEVNISNLKIYGYDQLRYHEYNQP